MINITVLGVCGSQFADGNTEAYLAHALSAAKESKAQTGILSLADTNIHDCCQCNYCVKSQKPGHFCKQHDGMEEIYPRVLDADGLIVASPANFGRLSVLTAIFLNRLRAFVRGNVYGGRLRNKVGGAMCVGWRRNAGLETTLLSINYGFLSLEMVVASGHDHGTFYGAASYSSIEGTGQFVKNEKQLVMKNMTGLKSAESLGKRVVELGRITKSGQELLAK